MTKGIQLGETRLKIYDTGLWCKRCQWYEDPSNITQGAEFCTGCGCLVGEHVAAHVVRA